jgi:methionyl aminopeptidase
MSPDSGLPAALMIIRKSKSEIERMRASGLIVAQVLERLSEMVVPGVTTRDLDHEAERMIVGAGAYPTFKGYHGYPSSICASINDEVVHGIPSKRKLREGDIVGIDCGATYMGYVGDAAVTVAVGKVTDPVNRLLEATRESLYKAIAKCRVGNRLGDVATPYSRMSSRSDTLSSRIIAATALAARCTKSRRCQITEDRERVRCCVRDW